MNKDELTFLARIVRKDTLSMADRTHADKLLKEALILEQKHISNTEVYDCAIKQFGKDRQMIKAIEEAGEYIQAVAKYIDNPDSVNKNALLGEMADVMITFNQLKTMTDISDVALFQMVDFKTRRLAKLLNIEE